ncbi:MAG: hypothetical protein J6T80_00750 [Paludibacteraceae bacterium]|nr:hypothetical protein [Paludibacteraceae bacterium]
MKQIIRFVYFAVLLAAAVGCKSTKPDAEPPMETLKGKVTATDGTALKGIYITVYSDTTLSHLYYNEVRFSDEKGEFLFWDATHQKQAKDNIRDVYVTATDTTEVYETKTVRTRIVYDPTSLVGQGEVQIQLAAKK